MLKLKTGVIIVSNDYVKVSFECNNEVISESGNIGFSVVSNPKGEDGAEISIHMGVDDANFSQVCETVYQFMKRVNEIDEDIVDAVMSRVAHDKLIAMLGRKEGESNE